MRGRVYWRDPESVGRSVLSVCRSCGRSVGHGGQSVGRSRRSVGRGVGRGHRSVGLVGRSVGRSTGRHVTDGINPIISGEPGQTGKKNRPVWSQGGDAYHCSWREHQRPGQATRRQKKAKGKQLGQSGIGLRATRTGRSTPGFLLGARVQFKLLGKGPGRNGGPGPGKTTGVPGGFLPQGFVGSPERSPGTRGPGGARAGPWKIHWLGAR